MQHIAPYWMSWGLLPAQQSLSVWQSCAQYGTPLGGSTEQVYGLGQLPGH
jgi:hypothetical protein